MQVNEYASLSVRWVKAVPQPSNFKISISDTTMIHNHLEFVMIYFLFFYEIFLGSRTHYFAMFS